MLLPIRFLLLVMVGKRLFLLPQPLGVTVMELFQAFVIKPRFDWRMLCLDNCVANASDGVICALGCSIKTFLCRYTTFLRFFNGFKQFQQ